MIVTEDEFLKDTKNIAHIGRFVTDCADIVTTGNIEILQQLDKGHIPYIMYTGEYMQLFIIATLTAEKESRGKFIELFKVLKYFTH